MSKEHNPAERALRRDIASNNSVRSELRRLERHVERWSSKASVSRHKRRRKQWEASIERARPSMKALADRLRASNEALKGRIQAEMKFSEQEVAQFQQQYRKERDEFLGSQAQALTARSAASDAAVPKDAHSEKLAAQVLQRMGRAERRLKKERQDVKAVEKELASEEADKLFFERELKRILADLTA